MPTPHTPHPTRWRQASRSKLLAWLVVGGLAGLPVGVAVAYPGDPEHEANLWQHGMRAAGVSAHPFLSATDGAYRYACAGVIVDNNLYPRSCYTNSHVHHNSNVAVNYFGTDAYVGSTQTGLSDHRHKY